MKALLLGFLLACSSHDDALEQRAAQAMAALNQADQAFPPKVTAAIQGLGSDLLTRPALVADKIETVLLPMIDDYVRTIDRAVSEADAYLATVNDRQSKHSVDVIRKRAEAFHKARAGFAALEQQVRAGASAENISQALMSIGLQLSFGS